MPDRSTNDSAAALADLRTQLDALHSMNAPALRARYREVFGEEARTHNVPYLRKKIAWRIQELAEGGLSERARKRIDELAVDSPIRYRGHSRVPSPLEAHTSGPAPSPGTDEVTLTVPAVTGTPRPPVRAARVTPPKVRDPRLPPAGTLLKRVHGVTEHLVVVLDEGFLYQGQRHASLSGVARLITGIGWNGFTFFGLTSPWQSGAATQEKA